VLRNISPENNSVFRRPINLPLYAYAADRDGWITRVEFFAGTVDLGPGRRVTPPAKTGPLPVPPPVGPTNLWVFVWSNAPASVPVGIFLLLP
jgi:hypothetical protein